MIITDHKVNGLNEAIEVIVVDNPGLGGANQKYKIELTLGQRPTSVEAFFSFQNGPSPGRRT